jgi:FkbM family methyltransferase
MANKGEHLMIDYSHPAMLKLREFGQSLGILRPMVRLYRRTLGKSYEESFDSKMLSLVKPGDVVWDIGANVGVFTLKFSDAVGDRGRVVAFEPAPGTFRTLADATAGLENVVLRNVALADYTGKASFSVSNAPDDPTNSLTKARAATVDGAGAVEVEVVRASDYAHVIQPIFQHL